MGINTFLASLIRKRGGNSHHSTAAVVLAGGCGSRMGSDLPKQFTQLGGMPVMIRTLLAFDECPYIDDIVLVIRREDKDSVTALLSEHKVKKLKAIVPGGETRQLSALRGFEAAGDVKYVAIHDAARCLVTPKMISEVASAAYAYRAAAAATPSSDTVKRANGDGFVCETLDRDHICMVQTPQIFLSDLYRAAAYTAQKEKFSATDDCMLVEHIGQRVKLVDCGRENIKITYPEDIAIAEAILALREQR